MASTEWFAWWAQYLTRIASQSTRTLDLSHQVLTSVARGQLTPAAIDDALREFAQARGVEYTDGLTELAERFTNGLMEVMGASAPDVYGGSTRTRPTKTDRPPSSTDLFEQITRLYADLLGGFNDLRAGQIEDCLRTLLASASATAIDPSRALVLIASIGDTASSSLIVENSGIERVVIRCAATDVRRADGVGPAFSPTIALAADDEILEPGQEGHVRASLWLDDAVYEPDVLYVGALHVMRDGGSGLEVPLRITATRGRR